LFQIVETNQPVIVEIELFENKLCLIFNKSSLIIFEQKLVNQTRLHFTIRNRVTGLYIIAKNKLKKSR